MSTQSIPETGRGAQSFEGTGPPTQEGNDCAQWPVRLAIYTRGRPEANGSDRPKRDTSIGRTRQPGRTGGRADGSDGYLGGCGGRAGGRARRGGSADGEDEEVMEFMEKATRGGRAQN
jgi:hypothetical protein